MNLDGRRRLANSRVRRLEQSHPPSTVLQRYCKFCKKHATRDEASNEAMRVVVTALTRGVVARRAFILEEVVRAQTRISSTTYNPKEHCNCPAVAARKPPSLEVRFTYYCTRILCFAIQLVWVSNESLELGGATQKVHPTASL